MHFIQTIETISDDGLTKVEYRFVNLDRLTMTLDLIAYWERQTKRHGWRRSRFWSRLNKRDSTIQREEPPQSVKDEVLLKMLEAIVFE